MKTSPLMRYMLACCMSLFVLAGISPPGASAAGFPDHPFRMVVPYPPGGGSDILARLVAKGMSERLGQPVVVENRPGASTIIAADVVAKAPADGYTLLLGTTNTYVVNPIMHKHLSYDAQKDFALLGMIGRFHMLLVASPHAGINSLKELVAAAKKAPGMLNYASPGVGTPHHLAMELFKQRADIDLLHVAFKGAAPAIQEVLAGRVQVMFLDYPTAAPLIKAGKLKALAMAGAQRSNFLPDLPTIAEQGYPGFDVSGWQALAVSSATGPKKIEALRKAVAAALADPAVKKSLLAAGIEPSYMAPAELKRYIAHEHDKWAEIIRAKHITVE